MSSRTLQYEISRTLARMLESLEVSGSRETESETRIIPQMLTVLIHFVEFVFKCIRMGI